MNATKRQNHETFPRPSSGAPFAGASDVATGAAGLDLSQLENVKEKGTKIIAACPACREAGKDLTGDHLAIDAQGRFGCVKYPGPDGAGHRKRIFALCGIVERSAPAPQRKARPSKLARTWATAQDAAKACTPRGFELVEVYDYPRNGEPFAAVARYEKPGDKTFRQFSTNAAGWKAGAPDGEFPLYGIEALPAAGPVWIVEGEKAQAAAASIGLPCVTSAGGSSAARKTDWGPLAGRDVILLPDADAPGERYARDVAGILHGLGCRVRIVRLPGLSAGGDIADFIDAAGDAATVARLADDAAPWTPPEADKPTGPTIEGTTVDAIRAALWAISQEKIGTTEAHRKTAAAVIEWLHVRGRFYHDAARRDFAGVLYFDAARKLLLPVQSDAFCAWLSDCLAVNRSERVFAFVASACETEGLSARATAIEPAQYWAARPGAVYLSNGPGSMAKVTGGGVELVDNGTDDVLFPVGACLEPWELVEPVDPFEVCALFADIAAAAPHGPMLFKLWAIALLTDGKTKPPACFTAPVGGGKTAIVRGLFALLGMPETVNAVSKNGEGDFWAAVDGGGLVCFDNVDTRVEWLPDALAAAATAGTFTKRRLYTDADRVTLRARASIAVTSANPTFASDSGLADRLLVIRMNRRAGETAESALFDEVRANRDAGLSWMAATLAKALADAAPVPTGLNARHPDFAALAVRIGRAMDREAAAVATLRAAESDKGLFNLENDSIGAALLELLGPGPFTGTAGELLEALKEIDPSFEGRLSDKRLGKRLSKLWPHLENTLAAVKERDAHTKNWLYTFRAPPSAVFAVFGELFSEKFYARENKGGFTKTPLETPQTPQDTRPDLFEHAETPEPEPWEADL